MLVGRVRHRHGHVIVRHCTGHHGLVSRIARNHRAGHAVARAVGHRCAVVRGGLAAAGIDIVNRQRVLVLRPVGREDHVVLRHGKGGHPLRICNAGHGPTAKLIIIAAGIAVDHNLLAGPILGNLIRGHSVVILIRHRAHRVGQHGIRRSHRRSGRFPFGIGSIIQLYAIIGFQRIRQILGIVHQLRVQLYIEGEGHAVLIQLAALARGVPNQAAGHRVDGNALRQGLHKGEALAQRVGYHRVINAAGNLHCDVAENRVHIALGRGVICTAIASHRRHDLIGPVGTVCRADFAAIADAVDDRAGIFGLLGLPDGRRAVVAGLGAAAAHQTAAGIIERTVQSCKILAAAKQIIAGVGPLPQNISAQRAAAASADGCAVVRSSRRRPGSNPAGVKALVPHTGVKAAQVAAHKGEAIGRLAVGQNNDNLLRSGRAGVKHLLRRVDAVLNMGGAAGAQSVNGVVQALRVVGQTAHIARFHRIGERDNGNLHIVLVNLTGILAEELVHKGTGRVLCRAHPVPVHRSGTVNHQRDVGLVGRNLLGRALDPDGNLGNAVFHVGPLGRFDQGWLIGGPAALIRSGGGTRAISVSARQTGSNRTCRHNANNHYQR